MERRWSVPLAHVSNCCAGAFFGRVSWRSPQRAVVHVLCVCAPGAHSRQFGCSVSVSPVSSLGGCLGWGAACLAECLLWSPELAQLGPKISWSSQFSSLVISLLEVCCLQVDLGLSLPKTLAGVASLTQAVWGSSAEHRSNGNAQVSQAVLSEPLLLEVFRFLKAESVQCSLILACYILKAVIPHRAKLSYFSTFLKERK